MAIITGTSGADKLTGTASADEINGFGGNDTLSGRGGADTLAGRSGRDSLIGGQGADRLNGGIGADTMAGGAANDTYLVDNAADQIVELSAGGIDQVLSSISYLLAAFVENLTLTGSASISATGNELGNSLSGNTGSNALDGATGADTLTGEAGGDRLFGRAGNDSLLCGSGKDTLSGGTGADFLDGSAGVDVLRGSGGDDVFIVNAVSSSTSKPLDTIDGGAGSGDTLRFTSTRADDFLVLSPDRVSSVEVVRISDAEGRAGGTASIDVFANDLGYAITIVGNRGDNHLELSSGSSGTLMGNGGDDLLVESGGGNVISGGAGNDVVDSRDGIDTVRGGAGNDEILLLFETSYTIGDLFDGGSGSDKLVMGNMSLLDLTAAPDSDIIDVEIIDIGEKTVSLAYEDVVAISSTTNTLRIDTSITPGTVDIVDSGWMQGADRLIGGTMYHSYTKQVATLLVDTDAFINI